MRVLFLGTPAFAVPTFKRLMQGSHTVVAAVTQPDRPQGRGQKVESSPVKEAARAAGVAVLQPKDPAAPDFLRAVRIAAPDCAIVVAYGRILPRAFLDLFPKGVYNLHASLLPKYRGAAPIQWALINGEPETGVTVFQLDEHLDHGPILFQEKVPIGPQEDGNSLFTKLANLGAEAAAEAMDRIAAGAAQLTPQDESKMILAPRLTKETGKIDWNLDCRQIHHLIRGVQPWPGAFTLLGGEMIKILAASPGPDQNEADAQPGEVVSASPALGLWVQTGHGQLRIDRLQASGGKPLLAADFLRGHPIPLSTRFE